MTDTMTDVYQRLALAIEDDLVENEIRGPMGVEGIRVWNERGLEVRAMSRLGAWTKALEACQRRQAWRASKVEAKAAREAQGRIASIAVVCRGPALWDDEGPTGGDAA